MRSEKGRWILVLIAVAALGLTNQACGSTTSTSQTSDDQSGASPADTGSVPQGPIGELGGGGGGGGATKKRAHHASPVAGAAAVQLASYQENSQATQDDPVALTFQKSLNALKPVCRESPYRVAAESWATWKDLGKNHVQISLLQVVRDPRRIGTGVPSKGRKTDCAALLAAYDVQLESGSS